jgi:hypothetical protein
MKGNAAIIVLRGLQDDMKKKGSERFKKQKEEPEGKPGPLPLAIRLKAIKKKK